MKMFVVCWMATSISFLSLPSSLFAGDAEGMWSGTIGNTRVAIEIETDSTGNRKAVFYNLDQEAVPVRGNLTKQPGANSDRYSFTFDSVGLNFEGTLVDRKTFNLKLIRGTQKMPFVLTRAKRVPEVEKRKSFKLPEGMNETAPMALAEFAFLNGEWHGKHDKKVGGGRIGQFLLVWKGEWTLDGNAMKNTSQTWALKPDGTKGRMTQHGMDIRTFNRQAKGFDHTYVDAISGRINKMTWKKVGDEIVSEPSEWMDYEGFNLNIIKFRNISDNRFIWSVDRSFDKGKTWKKNYVVIENVRVK